MAVSLFSILIQIAVSVNASWNICNFPPFFEMGSGGSGVWAKLELKVKIKFCFNQIVDNQTRLGLNTQSQFFVQFEREKWSQLLQTQPKTTSIYNWWLWVRKCNNTRFTSLVSVSYILDPKQSQSACHLVAILKMWLATNRAELLVLGCIF